MEATLDHLYRETHHWDSSVAFWANLGYGFAEQWGSEPHRAGRLTNGTTSIVLAEVPEDTQPDSVAFLSSGNLEDVAEATNGDIVETHWGTRMISLKDPEGRTVNVEARSGEDS